MGLHNWIWVHSEKREREIDGEIEGAGKGGGGGQRRLPLARTEPQLAAAGLARLEAVA